MIFYHQDLLVWLHFVHEVAVIESEVYLFSPNCRHGTKSNVSLPVYCSSVSFKGLPFSLFMLLCPLPGSSAVPFC
jgi:hypothetical protein